MLAPWKKSYDQPRQHSKQRHNFVDKSLSCQSYGFSSSHVWMWEVDHNESWAVKNWCFWIMVLEKILKSPLACKEIQAVNPKGNQSWIFIGRLMLKLELWYFGHLMGRANSLEKTLIAGKNWGQEEKGTTEGGGITDSMASPTEWTWVWASSGNWWWTEKPSVLQSMGSQRVGHDRATEMTDWLNDLVVLPTVFNLSLHFTISSS